MASAQGVLDQRATLPLAFDGVKKIFDGQNSTFVLVNGTRTAPMGPMTLMNPVLQGSEEFQRIGRAIKLDHIYIGGTISPTPGVHVNAGELLRLVVIYDAQSNGTAPALTDIWTDGAGINASSPWNMDNRHRFHAYVDKFWTVDPFSVPIVAGTLSLGSKLVLEDRDISARNDFAFYNQGGNPGTVGEGLLTAGSVWAIFLTGLTSAGSLSFTGNYRLEFEDQMQVQM